MTVKSLFLTYGHNHRLYLRGQMAQDAFKAFVFGIYLFGADRMDVLFDGAIGFVTVTAKR